MEQVTAVAVREEVRETQEERKREQRKGLDRRSRSRGRETLESEVITWMLGEEEARDSTLYHYSDIKIKNSDNVIHIRISGVIMDW